MIAQPLNWRLGVPELARILEDGEPSVLVTSTDFDAERQALEGQVEIPHWLQYGPGGDDTFERLKASADDANPKTGAGGDDPVLILYTGGTTGLSKGALHSHRTLYMGMLNQTVAERVVPSDVYMLTGQMFHIPVALAMNYMAHGCPVVLMNFDAAEALEIIQAERVSAFLGITTMLNWMMAVDGFDRYDLSSLRNIQYGGGPMPETVVKAALDAFPLHPDSGLRPDRRHDHDLSLPGGPCRRCVGQPPGAAQLLRTGRLHHPCPGGRCGGTGRT